MELYRLYALVHDCISCIMWRMDRVYVGLHVCRRRVLHTLLLGHRSDWKLSREYKIYDAIFCVFPRFQY